MKILKFPNPWLFRKADDVFVFGPELQHLLDDMWETMKTNKGIGLAANQVGLPFNMLVMEGPGGRLNMVNPIITERSRVTVRYREGCLSAPGDYVEIPSRSEWVRVIYFDERGNEQTIVLKNLYAVCVQHEIEHLDGKSFMENKSIHKTIRKGLQKRWGIK
jgi:peptide deformylase